MSSCGGYESRPGTYDEVKNNDRFYRGCVFGPKGAVSIAERNLEDNVTDIEDTTNWISKNSLIGEMGR